MFLLHYTLLRTSSFVIFCSQSHLILNILLCSLFQTLELSCFFNVHVSLAYISTLAHHHRFYYLHLGSCVDTFASPDLGLVLLSITFYFKYWQVASRNSDSYHQCRILISKATVFIRSFWEFSVALCLRCIGELGLSIADIILHGVSEKTVQNSFCQNFVNFLSILIIVGR